MIRYVATFLLLFFGGLALFLKDTDFAILNPKGVVALAERNLMITTTLLMLVVVIPVFVLTFVFAWRYRATNTKAKYDPDWRDNTTLEVIWWAIPSVIILVLGMLTWKSSHDLDPYRPLVSDEKPVTIQVVALDWKWLFIYPEENIATVNYFAFPERRPVNFLITADAPMNSFWIPKLGGQIYAMPGMVTKLHLMADEPGRYNGSSANFSGEGFSGMRFVAEAVSQGEFDAWVASVRQKPNQLSRSGYEALAKPSRNNPPAYYASAEEGLYDSVVMKYMMPTTSPEMPIGMEGMSHH